MQTVLQNYLRRRTDKVNRAYGVHFEFEILDASGEGMNFFRPFGALGGVGVGIANCILSIEYCSGETDGHGRNFKLPVFDFLLGVEFFCFEGRTHRFAPV